MKLVIATPFYPPEVGVLATYAEGIGSGLRQAGHEVVILKLNTALPPGLRQIVYAARLFWDLSGAAFVLSLDMTSVGIPAYLCARLLRVPFIVRIGGDTLWEHYAARTGERVRLSDFYGSRPRLSLWERMLRSLFARMLSGARHVFFNTDFQRKIWQNEYQFPAEKASVLENYYPPAQLSGVPAGIVFVSANRSTRYKNEELLACAFQRVQARHPEIQLDSRTLPHGEQLRRLASSYAAIIPSISEVGSNIAIESVTRGRPFIMTEDTGTKERLSECGLFVDTRSEEALEQAIESLLDPLVYQRLSDKCRSFAFTHSWEQIADEIAAAARV